MARKFNIELFTTAIGNNKDIRNIMAKRAEELIDNNKKELLTSLNLHPVTQEIEEGVDAENISGTLDGYGNLFSFIGFKSGDKPIQKLRTFLRSSIKLKSKTAIDISKENGGKLLHFTFQVKVPTDEELAAQTKMPWESGRSWLFDISRGISGFSRFISKKMRGRSKGGIEAKKNLGRGAFRNTSYWNPIWNAFIKSIGGKKAEKGT